MRDLAKGATDGGRSSQRRRWLLAALGVVVLVAGLLVLGLKRGPGPLKRGTVYEDVSALPQESHGLGESSVCRFHTITVDGWTWRTIGLSLMPGLASRGRLEVTKAVDANYGEGDFVGEDGNYAHFTTGSYSCD